MSTEYSNSQNSVDGGVDITPKLDTYQNSVQSLDTRAYSDTSFNSSSSSNQDVGQGDSNLSKRGILSAQASATASNASTNFVINGDFSAGNTGFSSDYTFDSGSSFKTQKYSVGTIPVLFNSEWASFGDHTTGTGNMLIADGSTSSTPQRVWFQKITVTPNTTYNFSAWIANIAPNHASETAQLQFEINSQPVGSFTESTTIGLWQQFSTDWNSGANTVAQISITDINTAPYGNDFALDDISFSPQISISLGDASLAVDAGQNKSATINFTVSLSSASSTPVTVDYQTADGTATASTGSTDGNNLHYQPIQNQTLIFAPGETSKQVSVKVYGDTPINDQDFEVLAKDVAYKDLNSGDSVYDLGVQDSVDNLGYKVDKVFKDPSTGFNALGLTSDKNFFLKLSNPTGAALSNTQATGTIYDLGRAPVLDIRGTNNFLNAFDDANPFGIGLNAYNANTSSMTNWLNTVSHPTTNISLKPDITGHSLGGTIAQLVAAYYANPLGQIVTFNSPGTTNDAVNHFNPNNADRVMHYITSADVVSMAGTNYLPGTWELASFPTNQQTVLDLLKEKHLSPVLIPKALGSDQPANLNITPKGSVDSLSNFWFTYLPDPDYFSLLAQIVKISAELDLAVPGTVLDGALLATELTFRGTTEANRSAIGTALYSIVNAPQFNQAYQVGQAAYHAAQTYGSVAWNAIEQTAKNYLNGFLNLFSNNSAFTTNNLKSLNVQQFSVTPTAALTATATTGNQGSNFWQATAKWSPAAWNATAKWTDNTWQDSIQWTSNTWNTTTQWTDSTWNNPFISIVQLPPLTNSSNPNYLSYRVDLSSSSTQPVMVNYATVDPAPVTQRGYTPVSGTLTFQPGEVYKIINVPILKNNFNTSNETFNVALSNPNNATLLVPNATGTVTDILLNNSATGANMAWLMNGTTYMSEESITGSPGWVPTATADFNHDGNTDMILSNTSNNWNAVWLLNGGQYVSGSGLPAAPGWQIKGAGDFNNDGNTDLVLHNTANEWNTVWLMNGTNYSSYGNLPEAVGWNITGVADFNGDGHPDLLLNNPSQGWNTVWSLNGTNYSGYANLPSAPGWVSMGVGDFNGNGHPDIIMHNTANGWNSIWEMNGTNVTGYATLPNTPTGWQISGMG